MQEQVRHWRLTAEAGAVWITAEYHRAVAELSVSLLERMLPTAALYYSKAVEVELRRAIFNPFRNKMRQESHRVKRRQQISDADPKLGRFITKGGHLSMGDMLHAIDRTEHLQTYLREHAPSILEEDIMEKMHEMCRQGNQERHDRLDQRQATTSAQIARDILDAIHRNGARPQDWTG